MASQAPDARELKTWEDAFQYPLPVIRKLEQQLRAGVHDNREKVRALVGSGYRDLLGTAERIIDMNKEMRVLEDTIYDVGQKCNSRLISRMTVQHDKLAAHRSDAQLARRRPASEVALLQSCLAACRRLLVDQGDLLLAARLLLLSRLLHNSASKSAEGADLLKSQRLKLAPLRSRLLGLVEDRLSDVVLSRGQTLDLLLAHSLVNTSSLADASKYLLRVRQQSISELCKVPRRKSLLQAIDLLSATLEQANSLFPRRMSEAMERLTGPHLLHDGPLRAVLDFDLAIYERWISNDIKSFIPWLRTNDLPKDSLTSALKQWAGAASATITAGLQILLEKHDSPLRISRLREKCLRHVLGQVAASEEFDKDELLMAMRRMFRDRLFAVTSQRARLLNHHVERLLRTGLDTDHKVPSIWDRDSDKIELRRGAVTFRRNIVMRTKGKDETLQQLGAVIAEWSTALDDVRRIVKEMKQTRWADELDLEESVNGNAGGGDRYEQLLATADSAELAEHLSSEAESALVSTVEAIARSAGTLENDSSPQSKTLLLLRILRAIPVSANTSSLPPQIAKINATLHSILATTITKSLSSGLWESIYASHPTTSLWQGSQGQSPLPVLPSPGVFRLLRALAAAMNGTGLDVWTPAAAQATRSAAAEVVARSAAVFLAYKDEEPAHGAVSEGVEAGADAASVGDAGEAEGQAAGTQGEAPAEEGEEAVQPDADPVPDTRGAQGSSPVAVVDPSVRSTQALFDSVYLSEILSQPGKSDALSTAVSGFKEIAALSDGDFDRLTKNAGAYHRRSYLLFGALV